MSDNPAEILHWLAEMGDDVPLGDEPVDRFAESALAAEQGANPLTVAKAYQGFQEDGLVTVKRGVGMFVAPGAKNRLRLAQREDFIKNIWPPVERQMKRLDLSIDDLVKSDA